MISETIGESRTMTGGENSLLAGRYRVVRQLGQGGMGSVWLAEDTELENRKVAIKMLPAILVANKRAYQQLKREALVSFKLTHPNIATLRSFEDNGGNPFLVMDYVDGCTLDDVLAEKGSLDEAETVRLLEPVAAALDYAHAKGVVHRDIKPGNVMVGRDGTPYVLDFGIAREIQETVTRVTGSLSSGTLLYMSPEQLDGEEPAVAQDVYSFSALAYECLAGHPPFCRGEIAAQIRDKTPDPLPGRFKIAAGVMAGLAKQARDRPVDCRGVLALRSDTGDTVAARECPRPEEREDGAEDPELAAVLAEIARTETSLRQKEERRRQQAAAEERDRRHAEALAQARARLAELQAGLQTAAGKMRSVELPGGAKLDLVWCPTGKDLKGNEVKGFWMGRTPVTQAQWRSVMGSNPSYFEGDDRPVEQVNWDDCQEFCQKAGLGLRLPAEREWEYACRAGSTGDWGKRKDGTEGPLDAMGWYYDNSSYGFFKGRGSHPVAQKEPNAWGLYDMHGNVWEWCADADGAIRVSRGGGWSYGSWYCAAGYRFRYDAVCRHNGLGLRLACSQD